LAGPQMEDRLEFDRERPFLEDFHQPQTTDLPAGKLDRYQVADGIPFRLAIVLRRDTDVLGRNTEFLFELGQEGGNPFHEDASSAPIDLRARPSMLERIGQRTLGLWRVGQNEESPGLSPAIQTAERAAI